MLDHDHAFANFDQPCVSEIYADHLNPVDARFSWVHNMFISHGQTTWMTYANILFRFPSFYRPPNTCVRAEANMEVV